MKKIILFFILFLPLVANAQTFKGGIVAGMNVSQIDGDNWAGYNKAGLVAGAFVNTAFVEKWGAQMEIRYAAKGSATPRYYSYNRKFRLQYIEIPLLATYEIVNKLKLQWGVSYGYLFSAAQNDGSEYYDFNEIPSRSEIAICFGINYEVFQKIDINTRLSYSMLPIWSDYAGESYGTGAWFNNVITFGLYYWLGKRD